MKLNKDKIKENYSKYSDILIAHLQYSLDDVERYNELTYMEKMIISEEVFNEIRK